MVFSQAILSWYAQNKRALPWRETRDPYKIWLSEIILQQTRVAQGLPYYQKFVRRFPKVGDLACANEEQILKLWQGLGYYSRARNLHAAAKMVMEEYNGSFPHTYEGLLKLKGVGDYTASAIASICFDCPEPVVDGNVYRVLSRYFGVDIPINSTKGIKYFKELAREVMDVGSIRDYNQGIMEFGAIQCTPQNPDCHKCPLNRGCVALQQRKIAELPVKINKTKISKRFFNYLVAIDIHGDTLLRQRKGKGIWQNLWEFPLLETPKRMDEQGIRKNYGQVLGMQEVGQFYLYNRKEIVHKLSHQHLYTKFWVFRLKQPLDGGIRFDDLEAFPVPVLIADFIKTFKI